MTDTAPEPAPAAPSSSSGGGGVSLTSIESSPILALIALGVGGYLAWFGVKYWRSQDVVWPSDPIKAILQGKPLPTSTTATTAEVQLTSYETSIAQQGQQTSTGGGGGGTTGPQPTGSAQNMARMLLGQFGWAASEMGPLILLWNRESGWNANARNGSSGAFGIAQALGHGTGCSAASNGTNEYGPEYGLSCSQAQAANGGSALWQIRWGLGYIKSRYGSPAGAWAHEESAGWY